MKPTLTLLTARLLAPLEQVLHEDALLLEPGPDPLPDFVGSHSLFLQCN
jgi:hypothetical protein